MRDIGIYFSDFASEGKYTAGQLGKSVVYNSEKDFILPKKDSIAIMFVPEYRNSESEQSIDFIHSIRQSLYTLYGGDWRAPIYDLGVVKPGKTVEDTCAAVKEIIAELVKAKVVPVIIGGSQDLTYSVYSGYQNLEQTVNILNVEASLDMGGPDEKLSTSNWLSKIVVHKPGYLFNYSFIIGMIIFYEIFKDVL